MNILMLSPKFPEETFWNMSRSDRAFMRRRSSIPPIGLLTVASYLPKDFDIRFFDRSIREESAADWEWADVVFISLMIVQRDDYRTCMRNARSHGKPVAIGGPFTHAFPEEAVADADWVCFGEAEEIMPTLVDDVRNDRRGKQYHGSNDVNVEHIKTPRFDLVSDINDYTTIAIQFSRGCPFQCEFCDIIEIYGRVPRTKTPAQMLAELDALLSVEYRGMVFLSDDNFIGNKKKAKIMLREIASWNQKHGYPYAFGTQVSINVADDAEMLETMARAGIVDIFIGIETPDPKLLKTTLKTQNLYRDPLQRLNTVRKYGIHITAGFILGFDGETKEVFDTQRDFMTASSIGPLMIGLLQALPHTQLSRRLKEEGRLLEEVNATGINTTQGINYIPKGEITKREYLSEYKRLIKCMYGPETYFRRILPGLLALRNKAPLRLHYRMFTNFYQLIFRQIYHLGIKDKDIRYHFWKTLLPVLIRNPLALQAFSLDCYFFFYLRQHIVHVDNYVSEYLRSPDPRDVLDEAIPSAVTVPAPAMPAAHSVRAMSQGEARL